MSTLVVEAVTEVPRGTVERMMEAAIDLYAAHGFEGTSLQMIADAIGVTKAAVYYHFKTKSDLLGAVIDYLFIDFSGYATYIESRTSRSAKVAALIDYLAGITIKRRVSLAAISGDSVIRVHPRYIENVSAAWDRILLAIEGPEPSTERRMAFYLAASVPHTVRMLEDLSEEQLRATMIGVLTPLLHARPLR